MPSSQKATQPYQELYKKFNTYLPVDSSIINALEKISTIKTIGKNEYLSSIYDHQRHIGFVIDGILRVYHLNENGTENNKNFFTKNDLFITSLDEKKDSSVFIQTITQCEMILFDYDDFMKLSADHDILESIFNKMFIDYMNKKQQREIELLSLDAKDRYIQFVKNHPALSKILPQFHIASYLGITPTQLSRIKRIFHNQHM